MKKDDTCYVCLRITPEQVLKLAHTIWSDDPEKAREKGKQSSRIIEDCYKEKPYFFCGRTYRVILGGLFYLIGDYDGWHMNRREKTQIVISNHLGTNETGIRTGKERWKKSFPKLMEYIDQQLRISAYGEKYSLWRSQ